MTIDLLKIFRRFDFFFRESEPDLHSFPLVRCSFYVKFLKFLFYEQDDDAFLENTDPSLSIELISIHHTHQVLHLQICEMLVRRPCVSSGYGLKKGQDVINWMCLISRWDNPWLFLQLLVGFLVEQGFSQFWCNYLQ